MAKPPPIARLLRELADIPAILTARFRAGATIEKRAQGQPVLVIPGFLANDASTTVLRRTLESGGFSVHGWGRGSNMGLRGDLLIALVARLTMVSQGAGGAKVILIGWSLGGIYARELAHMAPDLVEMVVTLGSPFEGDLHSNHAWRLYNAINSHTVDNLPIPVAFTRKPPVRTIAVWSPLDGVVAPVTSCGQPHQADEQIELAVTHMGFAASKAGARSVANIILDRVAA
ncbi:MAG: esterase/lipase family protein [Novosphingobium sp.]